MVHACVLQLPPDGSIWRASSKEDIQRPWCLIACRVVKNMYNHSSFRVEFRDAVFYQEGVRFDLCCYGRQLSYDKVVQPLHFLCQSLPLPFWVLNRLLLFLEPSQKRLLLLLPFWLRLLGLLYPHLHLARKLGFQLQFHFLFKLGELCLDDLCITVVPRGLVGVGSFEDLVLKLEFPDMLLQSYYLIALGNNLAHPLILILYNLT